MRMRNSEEAIENFVTINMPAQQKMDGILTTSATRAAEAERAAPVIERVSNIRLSCKQRRMEVKDVVGIRKRNG